MSRAPLFEDFGTAEPPTPRGARDDDAFEDEKLQAFENGYQAGWEDAIKAQAQSTQHVSSALAANLQDASFKYHEMRSTMNKAVKDILQQVIQTTLPKAAQASLGARICEVVAAQTRKTLDAKIVVAVAPANVEAVRIALDDTLTEPFDVDGDATLAPDQATIRIGLDETEIDMARVLDEIDSAVAAYFETDDNGDVQ